MTKTFIVGLILVLVVLYCIAWAYLAFRTASSEKSDHQKQFVTGHLPNPLPDGFYKGTMDGYKGEWKGKEFDQSAHTGINHFGDEKRHPFKTDTAKGLRDSAVGVFRIDYDVPQNPWWLRHLVDEVVEVSPGSYQGKIMIRWLGSAFTVGYFQLEK